MIEPLHGLDASDVFGVLVADLALDPQPQRRAVADGKRRVVESMRKYRLRMESVDQINAFIILSIPVGGPFIKVGAVEDRKTGGGEKGRASSYLLLSFGRNIAAT